MKRFNGKINIRWNKDELKRIKNVAPYSVSDFIRNVVMKEVKKVEDEKSKR